MNFFSKTFAHFLIFIFCIFLLSPVLIANNGSEQPKTTLTVVSSNSTAPTGETHKPVQKEVKQARGIDVDLDNIGGGFAPSEKEEKQAIGIDVDLDNIGGGLASK